MGERPTNWRFSLLHRFKYFNLQEFDPGWPQTHSFQTDCIQEDSPRTLLKSGVRQRNASIFLVILNHPDFTKLETPVGRDRMLIGWNFNC